MDTIIILGDVGLNYYLDSSDIRRRNDMWRWRRFKIIYYDIKNFFRNVWYYRKLLIDDAPWDNCTILLFLELRLNKTYKHYKEGLILPYVGEEEDFAEIKKALVAINTIRELEEAEYNTENRREWQDLHDEWDENIEILFNTLKQYGKWWD